MKSNLKNMNANVPCIFFNSENSAVPIWFMGQSIKLLFTSNGVGEREKKPHEQLLLGVSNQATCSQHLQFGDSKLTLRQSCILHLAICLHVWGRCVQDNCCGASVKPLVWRRTMVLSNAMMWLHASTPAGESQFPSRICPSVFMAASTVYGLKCFFLLLQHDAFRKSWPSVQEINFSKHYWPSLPHTNKLTAWTQNIPDYHKRGSNVFDQ